MDKLQSEFGLSRFTFGKRNTNAFHLHNWEKIDIFDYKIEKPVVLFLGGSGTNDNRSAHGNIKVAEDLLGVFASDVDVIGVNYNNKIFTPEHQHLNAMMIARYMFVPLLSSEGKKLDLDTAKRNMRMVTFFNHCAGATVTERILYCLNKELKKLDYSKEEIEDIFSQVFVIGYAPNTDIRHNFRMVKTVSVCGIEDKMVLQALINWTMFASSLEKEEETKNYNLEVSLNDRETLKKINEQKTLCSPIHSFASDHKRVFIHKKGRSIDILPTYMLDPSTLEPEDYDEHTLISIGRKVDWKKINADKTLTIEDWQKGPFASVVGDYVSRCLSCALCASVANSIANMKKPLDGYVHFAYFTPLDLDDLKENMENIVRPLNFEEDEKQEK